MLERLNAVFNRDNTVINTLETISFVFFPRQDRDGNTYVEHKQSTVILVENTSLDKREFLLSVLDKLLLAVISILLRHSGSKTITIVSIPHHTKAKKKKNQS